MENPEIIPTKHYSLLQLVKIGAFPWIKSYNSYFKLMMKERKTLKAKSIGEGNGTTYRILGQNVINYLNERYAKSQEDGSKAESGQEDGQASGKGAGKKRASKKADVGRGSKAPRKGGK